VTAGSGNVTFTGAVGNANALGAIAIDTTGTTTLGGNVTTTGAQTYNDAVELNNDIAMNTTNANIYFGSTINSKSGTNKLLSISVGTGVLEVRGSIGNSARLSSITINSLGRFNSYGAVIKTTNNQQINADMYLFSSLDMNSRSGDIEFAGKVLGDFDKPSSRVQNLTVSALAGLVRFNENVGIANLTTNAIIPMTNALGDLDVSAKNIYLLADILTAYTQTYRGSIWIGDNSKKGALYEAYIAYQNSLFKPALLNLSPINARTLISIDPSITMAGEVNDVLANTHSLFMAAISNPSTAASPSLSITKNVGDTAPLYSLGMSALKILNVVTNETRGAGNITTPPSVHTYSDQSYTTETVTINSNGIIPTPSSAEFTVDLESATISFNLYRPDITQPYELNSDRYDRVAKTYSAAGSMGLSFKGKTLFNESATLPANLQGWRSVSYGLSTQGELARLAALNRREDGESSGSAKPAIAANVPTNIKIPNSFMTDRRPTDGGLITAAIMTNTNFEIPRISGSGSVSISMGSPAKPSDTNDVGRDERLFDNKKPEIDEGVPVVKDEKVEKNQTDAACAKEGVPCE